MRKGKQRVTILTLFGIKDIHDHQTVLKELREGVNADIVDSGGRTLLMEAAVWKEHELIALLLQNGADVNVHDRRGWTALHFAAQNYDLRATKMLVEAGADVNAQDDYDNTVIWKAVMNCEGSGDVIQYLISKGAETNLKNKSGISAVELARRISNYDILPFMDI